jgi:hypothetical protein
MAGSASAVELLYKFELWPIKEQWLHECVFNHRDSEVIVCCEDSGSSHYAISAFSFEFMPPNVAKPDMLRLEVLA